MISCRYDYENVDSASASKMMERLEGMLGDGSLTGKTFSSGDKHYTVAKADNFEYTDPIDGSVSKKQVYVTGTYNDILIIIRWILNSSQLL